MKNLYWHICFTALFENAKDYSGREQASIIVEGYSFPDAYNRAARLYKAIATDTPDGATGAYCATVYLRDDGSNDKKMEGEILATYYIHEDEIGYFFSLGHEKAWALTNIWERDYYTKGGK